jgi:hypothetical protein
VAAFDSNTVMRTYLTDVGRHPRQYDGSALQRWHLEQREERLSREAAEREAAAAFEASRPQREAAQRERTAANVRHHAAKRRAARIQRTPRWADMPAIEAIYREAQRATALTGVPHHVDHRIPLTHPLVCGLHVHQNLQVLTGSENSRKRNRFEVA